MPRLDALIGAAARPIDEHDPGCGDVEDVDATVGQRGQQVDDVEVVDEVVGELHHRPGQYCYLGHEGPSDPEEGDASGRRRRWSVGVRAHWVDLGPMGA
jgi:hypothetical protein